MPVVGIGASVETVRGSESAVRLPCAVAGAHGEGVGRRGCEVARDEAGRDRLAEQHAVPVDGEADGAASALQLSATE